MLFIPPPQFRKRHKPARKRRQQPAPVLVSADYQVGTGKLLLEFDQAMDFTGLDGLQILVNDPVHNLHAYQALGAVEVLTPQIVRVGLVSAWNVTGAQVTLTAGASNGIVAAGGGQAWAGVTDLVLPFP